MRLVGRPLEVYQYLEPLYNDYRKVAVSLPRMTQPSQPLPPSPEPEAVHVHVHPSGSFVIDP